MKMNEQHRQLVWKKIKSKVYAKRCPACQEHFSLSGVTLYDDIVQMEQYGNGLRMYGGRVLPVVVLGCNNCGYLMNFSANLLGIIDPRTNKLIEV